MKKILYISYILFLYILLVFNVKNIMLKMIILL